MATRRIDQAAATRRALLGTARTLFGERGYAATPIEEITRRTNAARGAFYHHFPSKQQLFRAVVEEVEAELEARLWAAEGAAGEPWDQIEAACTAFLDAFLDPALQQILLRDAPAVLPPTRERQIEFAKQLAAALARLLGPREAKSVDAEALAAALFGAVHALSLMIARAPEPRAARRRAGRAIRVLVAALREGVASG